MIYPNNFEAKIGFNEIRTLLRGRCLSAMGVDEVNKMCFSSDAEHINKLLATVKEFRSILDDDTDFPMQNYNDMRSSLIRIQIKGTYLDEGELFNLRNTIDTLSGMVKFLTTTEIQGRERGSDDNVAYRYPLLAEMALGVELFPRFLIQVDSILNSYGKIKDEASPELAAIRASLSSARRCVNISLRTVLQKAQENGIVERDVNPTYRDGRLVIPVKPGMKRKLRGIVHDESATGKTVFIEPTEVVEANNRIRTLEAEEQRAIILILQAMTEIIRPQIPKMLAGISFIGKIDFIRAKSIVADKMDATEFAVKSVAIVDWVQARHPLLQISLRKQGKQIVPLDIKLTQKNRILLISGPNAGGKSVCLKTMALLQYMLQCGMSIPLSENSQTGVFDGILLDIGDEQSIENDLSTYSSHLLNMKKMMKACTEKSLVLIDEFGSGTEPQIGAAIAQAMLNVFLDKKTYGIITTHFQNLKYYADNHEGIVNGAMLYDRGEMKPIFALQIGSPGSSFAIEIARSIGLPTQVIDEAMKIVGDDYIKSDKYLQDIVRDKRYWENKRQSVHQKERSLQQMVETYERRIATLDIDRKKYMTEVKDKAELLFKKSNAVIENTIRSIKEAQADKEETRRLRNELNEFKSHVLEGDSQTGDSIDKKIEQIRQRRMKREERKKTQSAPEHNAVASNIGLSPSSTFKPGDFVKIAGTSTAGKVVKINGNSALVQTGVLKITIKLQKLELANEAEFQNVHTPVNFIGKQTRDSMREKRLQFKPDIDVRGMSGQEALETVMYFVEDAIQCGASRLSILHGTGTGYLRQTIRQYLKTVPAVISCRDEHVQFGGAGITIVELAC
jgi:DNA mismatch repair protein MutS2